MWPSARLLQRASVACFVSQFRSPPRRATTRRMSTFMPAQQYILKYDYVSDVLDKRGPHRQGHLDLAKQLITDGKCLAGGPTTEPVGQEVPTGAVFLFTDLAAAQFFVEQDPYVANGIVTSHAIAEWNVVVQKE